MLSKFPIYFILLSILLFFSCKDEENSPYKMYDSTYEVIQGEIWNKSCISCHSAGTTYAKQSNLVLTSDVSYNQLVNRKPENEAASEDGLLLVGDKGLESLYKSFLWEKINALDEEHFYSDHPKYGSIMPLGNKYLTNGQLEFVREWIISGALRDEHVSDLKLLNDMTRYETPPFTPLNIPSKGYQFHIEPFVIEANHDREIFVYERLNNDKPIFINQVEIIMRPGSHHFILYNFPNDFTPSLLPNPGLLRDVYTTSGNFILTTLYHMQFHQFVTGTQWPKMSYKFPEGVALKVSANTGFDMNSHYANKSDEAITGEVYANIHTIDEQDVKQIAEILNLNHDKFSLPANKITTLKKTFYFDKDINIFQLFSHAHSHMTEFRVFIDGGERNGELIYITFDWKHPPILELDPPLFLKEGSGLRLEATYDNNENRNLSFGLLSTDEMMILFGAYY